MLIERWKIPFYVHETLASDGRTTSEKPVYSEHLVIYTLAVIPQGNI
jgi:hypothetical protein